MNPDVQNRCGKLVNRVSVPGDNSVHQALTLRQRQTVDTLLTVDGHAAEGFSTTPVSPLSAVLFTTKVPSGNAYRHEIATH